MSLRGLGQQFLICMYIQLILPGQGSDFSLAQTSNDSPGRNLTLTVAQLEGHVKTWRSGVIFFDNLCRHVLMAVARNIQIIEFVIVRGKRS